MPKMIYNNRTGCCKEASARASPRYLTVPLLYGANAGYGATPYYSPVTINGNPFNVFIDTGTSYSWITTTLCKTQACRPRLLPPL